MGDFGNLPPNYPPPEARVTSDEIMYRFVVNNPPDQADFTSWRNSNPNKECPEGITECQACSLSLYADRDDADKIRRKVPRLRKLMMAEGKLSPGSGKIQNTPSRSSKSHHSWWLYIDREPWNDFQVISSDL